MERPTRRMPLTMPENDEVTTTIKPGLHYITLHKKLFRVAYSLKTSKPLNGAQMNQS